jgi:hypothetical protein
VGGEMSDTSDGSTASYYELPKGCTELQDLISHRNLNAQDGEMFRAIYRKGRASHSDELRDAKKVLFYAHAEVERLEQINGGLKKAATVSADHFDQSLAKYNAVASTMVEDFGQQNQLPKNEKFKTGGLTYFSDALGGKIYGPLINCPGCKKQHCDCLAR